jgi:hypothetical protein
MNYLIEMGSDATIYTRSCREIGSGIRKLIGGIHRRTKIKESLFFNKESRLKMLQKMVRSLNCRQLLEQSLYIAV